MTIEELGDNFFNKVDEFKKKVFSGGFDVFWSRFMNWGRGTFLGNVTITFVKSLWVIFMVSVILVLIGRGVIPLSKLQNEQSSQSGDGSSDEDKKDCTVAGLNLHGRLVTYIAQHADGDPDFNYDVVSSENITGYISVANDDPKIKAIIIEVDSGGGSPVAGEEIANAIKNSVKPVVALIRGTGASAAYWSISSASKIFASKNSDVGSIGVTSSYLSNVEKNKKDGYTYVQLSMGKYKDSGTTDKPMTDEERDLFMRDINIVYNNFVENISKNRNLSFEKVKSIADGSTVLGDKAKELGLIDEIGGLIDVEKYLEKTIGEKPVVCWK